MIKKFKVNVSKKTLNNIYKKVREFPFNDIQQMNGWLHGTNHAYLKKISKYWTSKFNWKLQEKKINKFNNYIANVDGINIHFIKQNGSGKKPNPLLILHGWPGSFVEFLHIVEKLTHPEKFGGNKEESFDVIIPSLPGFGFSDKPKEVGMDSKQIAILQHELLTALGYDKYIVQGGDWGATISKWMAELYPDHCIGIHLNMIIAWPPADKDPLENTSEDEQKLMVNYEKYKEQGVGYYEIQKTKPQTLGYGLNDSPIGLAAWIVEKFYGWFDGEENKLVVSNDEVLAIVSLYWFSESITSSTRLYKENGDLGFSFENIKQPMAGAVFERDLIAPPRAWAEEIYNVVQWNTHKGGHFAALEQPESLSADIIDFIKKLNIV